MINDQLFSIYGNTASNSFPISCAYFRESAHPGHQIPKTENRTKFTEIEKFGSLFGT